MKTPALTAAAVLLSAACASSSHATVNLATAGGFLFDLNEQTGSIVDGTSDAYDDYPDLWTAGSQFISPSFALSNGGRTVSYAPIQLQTSGTFISRTAYVPATGGNYVAYLETYTNTVTAPNGGNSFAMRYGSSFGGGLGSDTGTVITATSSGDTNVALGDHWFATDDATPGYSGTPSPTGDDDPALGHVIGGPGGVQVPFQTFQQASDEFIVTYEVELAPGQTKSYLFYEIQANTRAEAASVAASLSSSPDLSFLTPAQIATIQNVAVPVPEPTALGVVAGAGLLVLRRRRS